MLSRAKSELPYVPPTDFVVHSPTVPLRLFLHLPLPSAQRAVKSCQSGSVLTRLSSYQGSPAEDDLDSSKRVRRSQRVASQHADHKKTPVDHNQQLPSPLTHLSADDSSSRFKEGTVTPPEGRPSQFLPRGDDAVYSQLGNFSQAFSSPPTDTQAFSQGFSQSLDPNEPYSKEVKDEVKEGVWGYLFPLNTAYGGKCVVLRRRAACPKPDAVTDVVPKRKGKKALQKEESSYEQKKVDDVPAGGYLIGRHPECGKYP